MSNISKRKVYRSKTIRLLDNVSLDPASRARARASMEKAELIADFLLAAGMAIPSAIAWLDRSAGIAARRLKTAFTKSIQH